MKIWFCLRIVFIVLSFGMFSTAALAAPGIFVGETYSDNSGGVYRTDSVEECDDIALSLTGEGATFAQDALEMWSCRQRLAIKAGLEATSITLGICAIGTPFMPLQARAGFAMGTLALNVANFVIDKIPCDSAEDTRKIAADVCVMLQKQGMKCDVSKLAISTENR